MRFGGRKSPTVRGSKRNLQRDGPCPPRKTEDVKQIPLVLAAMEVYISRARTRLDSRSAQKRLVVLRFTSHALNTRDE
jgi:hypothetical protein